jgi:hypothetical protein
MPYFVISNFANGRDLRRSSETAPSGSLRVLRNAFVNEGGEIEKRKAFVEIPEMTAYAQSEVRRGRVVGPISCPTCTRTVFFRHRGTSLPGPPFQSGTAGGTTGVFRIDDPVTGLLVFRFWVQRSDVFLPPNASLAHAAVQSAFASGAYTVESFIDPSDGQQKYQHVSIPHTGSEPSSEVEVVANGMRPAQSILRSKSYVAAGNTLFASAIGDPTNMTGTGSGSVDLTTQGASIGGALALSEYFGRLVVFGRRSIMFWDVDPDFAANQYLRSIEDAIFSPRSAIPYGSGDVMYLTRSGIRSLQARDSSSEARVSDVGSPIDLEIREQIEPDPNDAEPLFGQESPDSSNAPFYNLANAIIHQESGQYWLALRDKIHVLSRYPSAKVLAWSSFDMPPVGAGGDDGPNGEIKGRWLADWCPIGSTIAMRNFNDQVFVYGGLDGATYDTSEVEVVTPFMDMGRPGTSKDFRGIDLVCRGRWRVEICTNAPPYGQEPVWTTVAEFDGSSRSGSRILFQAKGPHIAVRLTCSEAIAARISEVVIYYNEAAQK